MRKSAGLLLCAAALIAVTADRFARAQETPPIDQKAARPQDTFFSGNIVALTADKVTVSRRTITLSLVTKVFILDGNTQVEGKLLPKARVTVRFEKTEDGERAVRIIVRKS